MLASGARWSEAQKGGSLHDNGSEDLRESAVGTAEKRCRLGKSFTEIC